MGVSNINYIIHSHVNEMKINKKCLK